MPWAGLEPATFLEVSFPLYVHTRYTWPIDSGCDSHYTTTAFSLEGERMIGVCISWMEAGGLREFWRKKPGLVCVVMMEIGDRKGENVALLGFWHIR